MKNPKLEDYQLVLLDISQLVSLAYNPPNRESERAISDLREQILEADAFLHPIDVVKSSRDGMYVVVDGHRRVTLAREFGLTQMVAYVREYDPTMLWRILNSGSRKISPNEYMQAYQLGLPGEAIPPDIRRQIYELERLVGRKWVKRLASEGKSPGIIGHIKKVAMYCGEKGNQEFCTLVLLWFETYRVQALARRWVDGGHSPERLYRHVIDNTMIVGELI